MKQVGNLNYQQKDWLCQKYISEKLGAPKIAKLCGMGRTTIYNWMKEHGIKSRNLSEAQKGLKKPSPSPEVRKKLSITTTKHRAKSLVPQLYHDKKWLYKKYVTEKLSSVAIAEICNTYEARVWYWLKKLNIPTRDKSEATKTSWKNPEFVKKALQGREKRPSTPEKMFDEMTDDNIRYVGNRTWWKKLPNGRWKNPDFKVVGQDMVIEIFGDYWHRNDDPREIINLYKQIGLDCLVIWEKEIHETPQSVLEKLDSFISI